MKKILEKFHVVLLVFVLLLGFWLRMHDLYTWPRVGATFDEYAWPWIGISLIQQGIPVSWSPHPQYTNATDIIYRGAHFRLVKPYLEHPPLFGLVVGSFALVSGVNDMFHLDIYHIRGLALLLGMLSIVFVYLLATEVYDFQIGLLASLLYAIIPSIAVGSRIVQNENFFIPCFLFALFLIVKFLKTGRSRYRNSAAFLCGLLTLAKIPWAAASLAIILILFAQKKYKDGLLVLAIVLPLFALFFLYGIHYDSKLFFSLWQLQLHRYDITFDSMFALFTTPMLVDRGYIDGWIYLGWFAIVLLMVKAFKKHMFLLLPFLAYFAIFVYAIPNEPGHGWYRYPFYPFFAIAIALFLKEYFNKNSLLRFLFFVLTGLSMLQLSWAQSFGFSFLIYRLYLLLSGLTLVPLFLPKTQKIASVSTGILTVSTFILTVWTTLSYNEQ